MKSIDQKYWRDYVLVQGASFVEAVELDRPTVINGTQFEAGDYSMRTKGRYSGVTKKVFESRARLLERQAEAPRWDHQAQLLDRIEDLITQVVILTRQVERITPDGGQKSAIVPAVRQVEPITKDGAQK